MEFFHLKRALPFMRHARVTSIFSAITFVIAVAAIIIRGLNLGIDFTGGTVLEVSYAQAADLQGIRGSLEKAGFPDAIVQSFGTSKDVLIRLPIKEGLSSAQLSETVLDSLKAADSSATMQRVEFVGPQVGDELLSDGTLALVVVSIGIMIYLALRFEWRFAVAAIIASAHDVIIIIGLFALFQWEFDLTVLAAVLAILGYSVNDTVVVFDRIRENFHKMRRAAVPDIIDDAITATLSRTVITHVTTQLMVFAMLFLGGDILFYFALALTIGIVVGTYSSVLVASPVVMWLGISAKDLMKSEKKDEEAVP